MGYLTATILVLKELLRNMSWENLTLPFASGSESLVHPKFVY